jgi:hypothetical protein
MVIFQKPGYTAQDVPSLRSGTGSTFLSELHHSNSKPQCQLSNVVRNLVVSNRGGCVRIAPETGKTNIIKISKPWSHSQQQLYRRISMVVYRVHTGHSYPGGN